jgi:hypothetical protein
MIESCHRSRTWAGSILPMHSSYLVWHRLRTVSVVVPASPARTAALMQYWWSSLEFSSINSMLTLQMWSPSSSVRVARPLVSSIPESMRERCFPHPVETKKITRAPTTARLPDTLHRSVMPAVVVLAKGRSSNLRLSDSYRAHTRNKKSTDDRSDGSSLVPLTFWRPSARSQNADATETF